MPWLGTFHSIGVKILRRHSELVGLKSGFTILDTDDQIRLLKQVIEAEGLDKDRWPARQLAGLIDGWKNRGLSPTKVPAGEAFAFGNGKGAQLYAAYQKRLKELNAADFGDLLLEIAAALPRRIRTCWPTTTAASATSWSTSTRTPTSLSTCGCGSWRRARPTSAASATTISPSTAGAAPRWTTSCASSIDFPGATVIRLERNYRSTGHILGAASGLIARNKGRLGKTLFTDGEAGAKVTVTGVWDDEEEARGDHARHRGVSQGRASA